jgi:hypothetical protein
MVAESAHGPGFAADAGSGGIIQLLGLDERKGHIAVKGGIMREVDLLFPALTEEFLGLVAAIGKEAGLK